MAGLTTANDIIQLVLRSSGVIGEGQTASATMANDCLNYLNMMLGPWNNKRYLIYNLIDYTCVSTGNIIYSVGPGQDFDTGDNQRPDQIENAFERFEPFSPSNVDLQLQLIPSYENYAEISLKNIGNIAAAAYYNSTWPYGQLYVWPVPPAGKYQIHILVKNQLQSFPDLTTAFNMPPEYLAAIFWNLVCYIKPHFQLDPDPSAVAYAFDALQTIRASNSQITNRVLPAGLFSYPGRYQNVGMWLGGLIGAN